jgi:hypothetical protein
MSDRLLMKRSGHETSGTAGWLGAGYRDTKCHAVLCV